MNIEQFKGLARLPKFAIPSHYDLHLKLDLSAACTFYGTVKINLSITEKTNFLVLNANQLHVHQALFTTSGNQGLYRCTYVDEGVKKNMAVTQFEAADARRCFPCWDEPALKMFWQNEKSAAKLDIVTTFLTVDPADFWATFKITLDAPSELTALSNMPIIDEKLDGNIKTVYFEETPVMSTYLVAVVVVRKSSPSLRNGSFSVGSVVVVHMLRWTATTGLSATDVVARVKVRAYCPVGRSDEGKFALELTIKSLDIFTKYFSTPYPLPKLDMVAVPEFAAGAMENFGLIVYRDNEMLYSDSKSTARRKQRMSIVVAHEVAHHWFGNLVTMEWWTHLWLNEGFATWVEVHHVHGVEQVFDDIGYRKGSAIIRMLQGYLGDDTFQNAKTEDLWRVISEESGVNINSLMDCWTKQKGYPVIYVKSKDHILEFEQSQFLSSGLHGDGEWTVPITLALGSYDKRKNFLLESKFGTVDISEFFPSSDETLWIKVNVEQSGFYRVMYEDRLAAQLRKALENNCLLATDKFGILDDMFALFEACEQPLSSLLLLMNAYRNEMDNMVLLKLIDVCYDVVNISTDAIPDPVNVLKEFFINLLQCSAEKLGWESIPGESHLDAMLRGEVFIALATFGHDKIRREAMQRFQVLLNDKNTPLLSADVRKAAYISVMRNSSTTNRNGFESLLKFYREVRDQDIIYGLVGLSLECRETAWRWLKENWDRILKKYGSRMLLHYFVREIVTPLSSNEKAEEVEAFFGSHVNPAVDKILKQSIERIRIKVRWIQSIKQEQSLTDLVNQLLHKE
ncbi:hypothetical protein EZV62_003392 [Acer yangbiense]|uniref:Aminopeptidase n=1 Tax=Acer yangbiense TaxID=1000413 RepID=A0A5C7IGK9_9ROSI|nr:hypothetical protein EZV62_003392 [Acer yangbiense]